MRCSYGNVFLSYANETMYLLWDLTFFKSVLPETNFCPKPWADNGSTDQYSRQLFHGWRRHTLCHSISKTLIVGEGPGDGPSALRCLPTRDEVCPNPCPLSRWCHPTISSSVILSCPQSFPALDLCKWLSSSHQVAKVLEFQLQHQSFQWIFKTDFL